MTKKSANLFIPILFAMLAFLPAVSGAEQICTNLDEGDGTIKRLCYEAPPPPPETGPPAAGGTLSQSYSGAAGFNRNGVFGCNLTGSYSMSVGTLGALGGAYVPVNDAAVTLNTGYLVYKECVIKEVVNTMRIANTARTVEATARQFTTGRDGGAYFPVDYASDLEKRSQEVMLNSIRNGQFNAINPAFFSDIVREMQRGYYAQTRNRGASLACSYPGSTEQLKSVLTGRNLVGFSFNDILALADPNCIPLYAFNNANNMLLNDIAAGQQEMLTRLGWDNGIYGVEKVDEFGNRTTVTPGSVVGGINQQALQSGFAQQQSANDIGQIVGSLFANIGIQLISQNGGLLGLVQGSSGSPSYLSQVVAESSANLRDSAINAALQILLAAREVEQGFIEATNATARILLDFMAKLRVAEQTCWNIIIPKVKEATGATNCSANSDGTETCTTKDSTTIKIATSTAASQAIITGQIAPLATATASNNQASIAALNALDKLITDVTNSNSPDAQRTALQALDQLVAAKVLHTQYDQKAAEQRLAEVQNSAGSFVADTIKAWGDSSDPNVGWCNVNNPDVIKMWTDRWKQN
ncbi:MAG TPA: hypothetical protein VJH69_02380 [Candidatus Paceibacterota bacterium]